MVETDCLDAVKMVNSYDVCLTAEGIFVPAIRSLLTLLNISAIQHAPREANRMAHEIAYFVARDGGRFQWFGFGPSWLMSSINEDLPVTNSDLRDGNGSVVTSYPCFSSCITI